MKLLAVSGGVDSMVLFHKFKHETIGVIHINHNTRGEENKKEEQLIINECTKYNVPYYVFNYIHDGQGNFQQKAREFRYLKFKEICLQHRYEAVLTAHHFDDQIENILMNPLKIGRKTIREKNIINDIEVIRPLLNTTKKDLYNYAKINNIKYYEDSSNTEDKYLRNKIRIKLQNYTYEQKEQILTEENKRYETVLKKEKNYNKNNIYTNEINDYKDVYALLKSKKIKSNISLSKIKLILDFIQKKVNGEISIDKNNKLIVAYKQIYFINIKNQKPYTKKKPLIIGENEFNNIIFNNNNLKGFIRTYKKEDKIILKKGSKKINRFFIDNKIPKHLRESWPIIVDENDQLIKVIKPKDIKRREIE